MSSSSTPPPSVTDTVQSPSRERKTGRKINDGVDSRNKPDYFLAICYVVVYLELGWLILMLLRTYSRD